MTRGKRKGICRNRENWGEIMKTFPSEYTEKEIIEN
jgi:hypothetical protein